MHRLGLIVVVVSALALGGAVSAQAVTIALDYSYDALNFFDTQAKKDRLQAAADLIAFRLLDDLNAITPAGANTWTSKFVNPATGTEQQISNPAIPANTLRIYAGGRNLGASTLGQGGPGAYSASGNQAWLTTVSTRGEGDTQGADAVEFGPWGGSLSFTNNAAVNWNFDASPPPAGQFDFFSTALHELGHLLGFGTSDSWDRLVSGGTFNGAASVAEYDGGGSPPLGPDNSHWLNGTTDGGRETAMDPSIGNGLRKPFTELDYAALSDIGWSIGPPPPLPGDANFDGAVNIFDINLVSAHWSETGPTGDANGDGAVNIFDINLISAHWGAIPGDDGGAGGGGGASAVPEPTTMGLATIGSLATLLLVARTRRGR